MQDVIVKLTTGEAEILRDKHLRLAHQLANKFAAQYGQQAADMEELAMSELGFIVAEWGSAEYSKRYNPKKCNPTSWIYRRLYYHLLTHCLRKLPREVAIPETTDPPATAGWLERLLTTIGEDARIILDTIVSAPAEIAADLTPARAKRAAKAVRGYMAERGWDDARFRSAWDEVGEAL